MLRRDVLRWAAAAGVSVGAVSLLGRRARALSAAPAPLFVAFEAVGAYDVTLMLDPKGNNGQAKSPNTGYAPADIKTFGAFQVAPQIPSVVDFYRTYSANMLGINGIDTHTIDHATGMRSSMSGTNNTGYPVTAALLAGTLGQNLPAAFMCNGGSNDTENVVAMTQLGSGIADALQFPMNGGGIHRSDTWNAIDQAIAARLAREAGSAQAPLRRQRLALMKQAFVGADALSALTATVQDLSANVPLKNPSAANLQYVDGDTATRIQVGLAGYVHGQTAAIQVALGTFDTHSDNDAQQAKNLDMLLSSIDYVLRCAVHLNLQNSMLVYVGSDFGRAPYYNSAKAGKDHWPVTSVMFIDLGSTPTIPVNTRIGQTDAGLNAQPVNIKTLKPDTQGVTVQPGHVHDAIRRYYKIDQQPLAMQYGLRMTDQLPLLG